MPNYHSLDTIVEAIQILDYETEVNAELDAELYSIIRSITDRDNQKLKTSGIQVEDVELSDNGEATKYIIGESGVYCSVNIKTVSPDSFLVSDIMLVIRNHE